MKMSLASVKDTARCWHSRKSHFRYEHLEIEKDAGVEGKKWDRKSILKKEWSHLAVLGYDGMEVTSNSKDFWDVFCYGN